MSKVISKGFKTLTLKNASSVLNKAGFNVTTKELNLLKNKIRTGNKLKLVMKKSKGKSKKCNPYKTGPAEWKTVEYVSPKSIIETDPYGRSKEVMNRGHFRSNEAAFADDYSNYNSYSSLKSPNLVSNLQTQTYGYDDDRIYA